MSRCAECLYTVGQRVLTPYGEGTVLGFEAFGDDGMSIDHCQVDNGVSRIVVQLDRPEDFAGGVYGNPFFTRFGDKLYPKL